MVVSFRVCSFSRYGARVVLRYGSVVHVVWHCVRVLNDIGSELRVINGLGEHNTPAGRFGYLIAGHNPKSLLLVIC